MSKIGKVYYDKKLAGRVSETDAGYEYRYEEDYLADPSAKSISLTLPIRHQAYYSKTLFAFFDGLIPEGWLLDIAKEHWKVQSNDRFELLLLTCKDTIGAVTVVPEEEID
jgi:serine/threonine-protein kinase HipA